MTYIRRVQGNSLNDLSSMLGAVKPAKNGIDVEDINPEASQTNPFPIDSFPPLFRDLAKDLNTSLRFPIDYTATAILTAVSTAIGTTAKVQVKGNWYEYASVFTCIIGSAGANKTHPIKLIFEPIREIDKRRHDEFEAKYNEYINYGKLTKVEKELIPTVHLPILDKSVLTNFTPEVLNKRLSENLRGCTIVSDEMATFFEGMNQYSKGDQVSVYLSFWSNQATTIDRIGNPIPLFISNPYLSVIGGLQPRMLSSAFPVQKLNNGFFQRFLYAFPESSLKQPISDIENDENLYSRYKDFIQSYMNSYSAYEVGGKIESRILRWTPEAKTFFYKWQSENCELVDENQNTIKGEIATKYDNHFIRLALLLQLMFDPQSESIDIKAVEGAKELCTYYMNCAFKVLSVIQDPGEYLKTLPENKRLFYKAIQEKFTTKEAIQVGLRFEFLERRVKEFLKDTVLFKKVKQGTYEKTIKSE
jgi:hypothetical protein